MPTLALVPSPLLGPATWTPVADALRDAGWSVLTAGSARLGPTTTPSDVLAGLLAELPEDDDLVLVPHSNAGLYVPALVEQRRVAGVVFVDAGLPPAHGSVDLAPAHFLAHLRGQADADDVLPPWSQWFAEQDVVALFPTHDARVAVESEQPRLPLSYFTQALPVPVGWDRRPCAYLAFGDTYAEERAEAERRGWPVETLPGGTCTISSTPQPSRTPSSGWSCGWA